MTKIGFGLRFLEMRLGKVVNSAGYACDPSVGAYKDDTGEEYVVAHCRNGEAYMVHILPNGTDTQLRLQDDGHGWR
ncbi:MAG: hypothetical protein OEQ18_16440 [Gammaproteobacteria bacterium]|nr:hypothetical protein [Gammaproteobacteria bacterium]